MHPCVCTCMYAHVYTCVRTHMYVRAHMYMCACESACGGRIAHMCDIYLGIGNSVLSWVRGKF